MKSAAIYAPLAAAALAQAFTINTPASVTQCQPTLISWDASDSQAPYYLSILPGDNPSGQPLKQFDISDGSSYSWNTDIAGGTSIGLTLKDSTGKTVQSAPVTIQNSSDDSCLNGSSSSGSASSAASTTAASTSGSSSESSSASSAASTTASSSAASTTATSAATSSRATTSGSSSTRSSTSTSSSASSSSSSASDDDNNGALVNGASLGVAGAVAALVAFLA